MMGKSQTQTSFAYPPIRGTLMSREIGGRRETAPVSDLPPETPNVTIRDFFNAVAPSRRRT
jgi:hypothetical protein